MESQEIKKIKDQLLKELISTKAKISEYTELSKPIAPENAIGRVSRMDAINNKSIVEAALRESVHKFNKLKIIKKKIEERLQQRFDYENASDFYHCGNEDCPRVTFEEALDGMFKCPSCQNVLNIKKNEKSRKAYSKKIDEIKKDMQQIF